MATHDHSHKVLVHGKNLGTLAEKLEFSNALLKQERIEHGKSKAYIDELEHAGCTYRARIAELEQAVKMAGAFTPKMTPEERAVLRTNTTINGLQERCKRLLAMVKASRNARDQVLNELNRLKRIPWFVP